MKPAHAAAFAAFCLLTAAAPAARAQDVTLTSRDGSVSVSGTLLNYDGEFYRVESGYGVVTLDGARVTCAGSGCPDTKAFVAVARFSGARRMGEVLMPALVESFAIRNGYALERREDEGAAFTYVLTERGESREVGRLSFRLQSSDEGFADLVAEEADIVMSTREVSTQEAQLARTAGIGDLSGPDRARIVALDGVVPLVSVANPAREIGLDEIARVVSGEVTAWSGIGGPDEPLALHLMAGQPGLNAVFAQNVGIAVPQDGGDRVTYHDSVEDLAAAVASDPFALGIGSYAARGDTVPLTLVGPCGSTAEASDAGLKTEDYPLTAPLFVYTPARRLPRLVRDFLAFATSPAAQPVIRRAGFVDQFPEAIPLERQGLRFANAIARAGEEIGLDDLQRMVGRLMGKSRLTLTFRFENGSSALDAQSRSNVSLLAEALERGVFADRRLLFAGFSDGDGPASINRRLAMTRAAAVRDAVRAAVATGRPEEFNLDTAAFGEAMPMACDRTDWGRRVNRRVEVWID